MQMLIKEWDAAQDTYFYWSPTSRIKIRISRQVRPSILGSWEHCDRDGLCSDGFLEVHLHDLLPPQPIPLAHSILSHLTPTALSLHHPICGSASAWKSEWSPAAAITCSHKVCAAAVIGPGLPHSFSLPPRRDLDRGWSWNPALEHFQTPSSRSWLKSPAVSDPPSPDR
jgi:hypothetical protein